MNLFVAELNRLWRRRALRVLALIGVLLLGFFMLLTLPMTQSDGPTAWEYAPGILLTMSLGTALGLSMLLGATYWGADFRHGTIGTLLTFVPDRRRVWIVRTLVVILASLAFGVAMLAATLLAMMAFSGGQVIAQAPWPDLGPQMVRFVVGCVLAGLLGAFLALIFRNTAAAAVVPLAYLFVRMLLLMTGLGMEIQLMLPETYVAAFLAGGMQVPLSSGLLSEPTRVYVGVWPALGVLLGILAVLGAVSLVLFDRRSITE